MSSRVFLLLIGLIFFGGYYYWNGHTKKSEIFVKHSSKSSGEQSISLMTFNVENFYDIENDPQKNDDTFLPIHLKKNRKHKEQCQKIRRKKWREECLFLDWSSAKFKDKARKIAQVIEQANPDIVVLQEVENLFALNKIQGSFEKIEVFPTQVLIEGRDYRGIDIALLARFPVGDMGLGLNYADLGKKMVLS